MDEGAQSDGGSIVEVGEEQLTPRGLKRRRSTSSSRSVGTPKKARSASPKEESPPPFFFSSTPDPYPPALGHLYDYAEASSSSSSSYLSILGDPETTPPSTPLISQRICFNCSSPSHLSSACPFRKDAVTIAANRAAFQLENPSTPGSNGARLSGDTSIVPTRFEFVEMFKPGVVRGEGLRRALGVEPQRMEAEVIEFPWYQRFAEWGYPPGYYRPVGTPDPLELVKIRIGASDLDWSNVPPLLVYTGDSPPASPTPPSITLPPPLPSSAPPPPPPDPPPLLPQDTSIRLVTYRSAYHDFSRLPPFRPRYPFPFGAKCPMGLPWQVDPVEEEEEEDMELETETEDEGDED